MYGPFRGIDCTLEMFRSDSTLLILLLLSFVPLPVLDARITACHNQLASQNLSVVDRMTLANQLKLDMIARYRLLEDITD